MDHEKEKKTCQNQKIGQVTLHIPLSKPCWCRWRVSIQRSYRAPDQPCKPSRRLYLGLPSKEHEHIADVPQKLPVFTVPKKSRDLGSFAMWSPQIIHFGVQKEFRKTANHFFKGLFQLLNKNLRHLPNMDSPQDLPTYSCPWPTWNPSTSGSPVPNSCKTARIPKPSHPHPGFSQRTATCQVAQTFALSIDAEEVLHQILLRHLKLSTRMGSRNGFFLLNCWDSQVNPGGFFGGVDWLMIFHRKVARPNLILYWGFFCTQYLNQY